MKLSEDLAWRGLIKDKTFDNNSWLDEPRTFYHGVDASSADSMTIGNLAAMLMARRLLDGGWKAVLLAGGATSLIGDPKDNEERELKPREEIQKNIEAIKNQINQLFAGKKFTAVDNYDWFKDIRYLDFLREVGKNFAMSELMQREFVTERLETGISYAEFSYSLIQGYDYWQLYQKHNVVLQIGGSDQWGNMLSGVSLIRKKETKEVHALSMPLVLDRTTGRKFGKSEAGAIWLDPDRTSPTEFYQFWINVDDSRVEDFLKIYTLLNKEDIEDIMKDQKQNPQKRPAQIALARHITELVHGRTEVQFAESVGEYLTGKTPVKDANSAALKEVRQALPHIAVQPGISVIEALVESGLAVSNSDARRLVQSKAVYINGEPLTKDHLEAGDFENGPLMLRRGKAHKDTALVELA